MPLLGGRGGGVLGLAEADSLGGECSFKGSEALRDLRILLCRQCDFASGHVRGYSTMSHDGQKLTKTGLRLVNFHVLRDLQDFEK